GSIDLKGGRLDDLVLKDYHETISKESPLIRLFSPSGAPDAYWADTGYVSAGGVKTPTLDTVWTASANTLTPEKPVTLTWNNGAGLVFKRVIAVDDKYMFTITDSVANEGEAAATVRPMRSCCATASPTSPAIRCCTRALSACSATAACRRSLTLRSTRTRARR